MALALQNPNDRRRINRLARLVVKSGGKVTPQDAVTMWLAHKSEPAKSRPAALRSKGKAALLGGLSAPKLSKAAAAQRRNQYAAAKHAVAKMFAALDPQGYKPRYVRPGRKGKAAKKWSYASVANRTKATRYKLGDYRATAMMKVGGKMRKVRLVDVANVMARNTQGKKVSRPWKNTPKVGWRQGAHSFGGIKEYNAARKSMSRKAYGGKGGRGSAPAGYGESPIYAAYPNPYGALALQNPYGCMNGDCGALALQNPGVVDFLKDSLPVLAFGGGAAAIHYFVVPMVQEYYAKIPGVGEYIADYVPYTVTGLLLGGAIGLATGYGVLPRAQAMQLAGMAIAVGAAFDVANYLGSSGSDVVAQAEAAAAAADVTSGVSALGGIGYNPFAGEAVGATGSLGDGMSYETASVGGYNQASLADAYYSGADFGAEEGQAIVDGQATFVAKFGAVPVKQALRKKGPSHLAGRLGHRWGWLIKLLGWKRVQALAAMAPKKRVEILKQMRLAAIKSFQSELIVQEKMATVAAAAVNSSDVIPASPTFEAPSAGTVAGPPMGASGPMGPGDMGAALFMGD